MLGERQEVPLLGGFHIHEWEYQLWRCDFRAIKQKLRNMQLTGDHIVNNSKVPVAFFEPSLFSGTIALLFRSICGIFVQWYDNCLWTILMVLISYFPHAVLSYHTKERRQEEIEAVHCCGCFSGYVDA